MWNMPQLYTICEPLKMFDWQSNSNPGVWGLAGLSAFLTFLPVVCLIRPFRVLICSPQVPNQRRRYNQWGGWIVTGIWNPHQLLGSMCLRPFVFVFMSLSGWKGSTFVRTATLCVWAVSYQMSVGLEAVEIMGVDYRSKPPQANLLKSKCIFEAKSIYLSIYDVNWSCGSSIATMKDVRAEVNKRMLLI